MPHEVSFVETMTGPTVVLRRLRVQILPTPGADDGLHGTVTDGVVELDGRPFPVSGGSFAALVRHPLGGRRLRYTIRAGSVRVYGVKTVSGRIRQIWRDTSNMRVMTVHDGKRSVGAVRISATAFARQLTTMRGGPGSLLGFGWGFARRLLR